MDNLLLSGGPIRVAVQQQHSSHPDNYSRGTKRLFGISVAFVIKIIDHRSARGATGGDSKRGGGWSRSRELFAGIAQLGTGNQGNNKWISVIRMIGNLFFLRLLRSGGESQEFQSHSLMLGSGTQEPTQSPWDS